MHSYHFQNIEGKSDQDWIAWGELAPLSIDEQAAMDALHKQAKSCLPSSSRQLTPRPEVQMHIRNHFKRRKQVQPKTTSVLKTMRLSAAFAAGFALLFLFTIGKDGSKQTYPGQVGPIFADTVHSIPHSLNPREDSTSEPLMLKVN